jgi:DNA repair photolyase
MSKFVNEPIENWGNYVYVKRNAVELLKKDLSKLSYLERRGSILFSSVTDPYQGAEAKYRLTRGMLEVLADEGYPGEVGILTKSSMLTRDIDVMLGLKKPDVGMTITTTDDNLSRFLEVRASATSARLSALRELCNAGLKPYAFVGPLLPHFRYAPELLDDLFMQLADAGVRDVYVEHINLKPYIRARLWEQLKGASPAMQAAYKEDAPTDAHRKELDKMVAEALKRHGLSLRLHEVLYHTEWMKANPKD